MPRDEVHAFVLSQALESDVQREYRSLINMGVSGVPFFQITCVGDESDDEEDEDDESEPTANPSRTVSDVMAASRQQQKSSNQEVSLFVSICFFYKKSKQISNILNFFSLYL